MMILLIGGENSWNVTTEYRNFVKILDVSIWHKKKAISKVLVRRDPGVLP